MRATYQKKIDGNYIGSEKAKILFEDDGSVVRSGDATIWRDLVFPLIQKNTGPGNPSFTTFNGNLVKPQFAVNDAIALECSEFVHQWREGSTCDIHVHVTSMTNVAAARGVKFEVEYSYVANSDGTAQWIAPVTVAAELTIPANTPALTEFVLPMTMFTPTGGLIGAQLCMRLKRVAAAGTAPAADPFVTQVGVHIECDTDGSRDRFTK